MGGGLWGKLGFQVEKAVDPSCASRGRGLCLQSTSRIKPILTSDWQVSSFHAGIETPMAVKSGIYKKYTGVCRGKPPTQVLGVLLMPAVKYAPSIYQVGCSNKRDSKLKTMQTIHALQT